jgi:rhodanese-related sulfurtransferase
MHPAFGSAKDAINQTGYVGNNVLSAKTPTIQWHELEAAMQQGTLLVDVRTQDENSAGSIPGSMLVPVDTLRRNIEQLKGKEVVVTCAVGQRGHTCNSAAEISRDKREKPRWRLHHLAGRHGCPRAGKGCLVLLCDRDSANHLGLDLIL